MPVEVPLGWLRREEGTASAQQQTVYCHLLDTQGRVVAQVDGSPRNGLAPLGSLKLYEMVADARAVLVPVDASAGVYQLRVGVYDMVSGKRLLISGTSDDGVDVGTVMVVDG